MDNVEKVARALASADGLDWDEVCGVDDPATEGFCDSGTCIAAHWEDHDQEQARRWYLHLARSALVAIDPVALEADVARLREFIANPPKHNFWGAGEPDCPRELKAGNGELHTLRCKVCGLDSPKDDVCRAQMEVDHAE
jgi:hypothetical protein